MEPLVEALAHVSETEETLALHDKSLAALGDALNRHAAITALDLSRCSLTSLDGLHHLPNLTRLSLYYNQVADVSEVNRLKYHPHLRSLDLRLNPVARAGHRYRLCVLRAAPGLHVLDEREVDAEPPVSDDSAVEAAVAKALADAETRWEAEKQALARESACELRTLAQELDLYRAQKEKDAAVMQQTAALVEMLQQSHKALVSDNELFQRQLHVERSRHEYELQEERSRHEDEVSILKSNFDDLKVLTQPDELRALTQPDDPDDSPILADRQQQPPRPRRAQLKH